MSDALLILILLVSALAAVLAGLATFSNNRPPDNRLGQVLDEMEDIKGLLNQLQKSVLQAERKADKDNKDLRNELKELLERMADKLDKRLQELA